MRGDFKTFGKWPAVVRPIEKPAFRVRDLRVHYGRNMVLNETAVDITSGKITALIGPSGCGKSTFLTCLNRLIDMVPGASVSGCVEYNGEPIFTRDCNPVRLRRHVGMIFQTPNLFPFSIRENLLFPLKLGTRPSKAHAEEKMEQVLRMVGIWEEIKDRLKSTATHLSGGQQQRVCIARALMTGPDVLLMDEPCSALDPISSATVETAIAQLRGHCTIVLVTHNIGQAQRISDRIAVFWYRDNAGTIIEENDTEIFFRHPREQISASYIAGRVA